MSDDSFTTTTSQSWFSRIGNALSGILFGIVFFGGSFVLLTWNEGRAIHRAKTLEIGAKQVVSLSSDAPDAANEGKLVHLTGDAVAGGPVVDRDLGISANALKLRRDVQMFQWKEEEKSETKKKLGGSEETTTTYSYSKDWSSSLINSGAFKKPAEHVNPKAMPLHSETFTAGGIRVGKFVLSESLTDRIDNYAPRKVTDAEVARLSASRSKPVHIGDDGLLYFAADPKNPVIGDLRITMQQAPSGPVSLIAKQVKNTFGPFAVANLGSIELLVHGTQSAEIMFQQEQQSNMVVTWILRLVGFVVMLIGLMMMMRVFSVLASVVPFFGSIVETGTALIASIIALPLTLGTIALAWLAYRPLIGIPIAVVAVGCTVFGIRKLAQSRKTS